MKTTIDFKTLAQKNRKSGWILEPDAKASLKELGLDIPDFILTVDTAKACDFLATKPNGVVAKAVSKKILHKTEHQAVVPNIHSKEQLIKEVERLKKLDGCETVLIEEMVQGIEVIVGAKNDFQFGPVVVFGVGGTSVEIYNDTAIRLAPLKPDDVLSMVNSLKAEKLITGFRGNDGVNMTALTDLLVRFSHFVIQIETEFESIDLNPVICTKDQCVIADARIILSDDRME